MSKAFPLRRGDIAELARRAGVPYLRVWRALTGGLALSDDERLRLRRAAEELQREREGAGDEE